MKPNEIEFPKEWVELVKEAMKSGIKKEDFKKFLIKEIDKRDNKGLTY